MDVPSASREGSARTVPSSVRLSGPGGGGDSLFRPRRAGPDRAGPEVPRGCVRLRGRLFSRPSSRPSYDGPSIGRRAGDLRDRRRRPDRSRARRGDRRAGRCGPSAPASGGSIPSTYGSCCSTPGTNRCTSSAIGCRRSPARELEQLGVELRLGVQGDGRSMKRQSSWRARPDREQIRAPHGHLGGEGVPASPLSRMLAAASGAPCNQAGQHRGEPDCTLPDPPGVFAIGDMASLDVAGRRGGGDAAGALRRQDHPPSGGRPARHARFKYRDLGSMATIGRFRAVVSVRGLGSAAWRDG